MESNTTICGCGRILVPRLDASGKKIGVTHETIEDEEHHSEYFSSLAAKPSPVIEGVEMNIADPETTDERTYRKLSEWYLKQLRECQEELRALKSAPVIEIGESINEHILAAIPNWIKHAGDNSMAAWKLGYKTGHAASHPAPAPIVGERGPNLSKIEEQVDNVLAAETDESLRGWYVKQPQPAPAEQVLPEEVREWIEDYAANERKGKDLHYGGYVAACHALYHKMQEEISGWKETAALINKEGSLIQAELSAAREQLASARALITKIKRWDAYQEPADECDKWLNGNPEIK